MARVVAGVMARVVAGVVARAVIGRNHTVVDRAFEPPACPLPARSAFRCGGCRVVQDGTRRLRLGTPRSGRPSRAAARTVSGRTRLGPCATDSPRASVGPMSAVRASAPFPVCLPAARDPSGRIAVGADRARRAAVRRARCTAGTGARDRPQRSAVVGDRSRLPSPTGAGRRAPLACEARGSVA